MTKRNLLLVSLLLALGLAATSPSLYAVTGIVFGGSSNTVYYNRNEGDAEGVGTISLGTTSTGTIKANSAWYVTYNAPIANAGKLFAVSVSCTGDFGATVCGAMNMAVATSPFSSTPPYPVQGSPKNNQVVLTFLSDVILTTPTTGTQINIAVRLMDQGLPYNYELTATVRAYYQYSNWPMTVNPIYPAAYEVGQIGPTQALAITFKEGPELDLTCIGIKDIKGTAYDNDFSLVLTENWANALTSESDEDNFEEYPPPAPNYVTTGPFATAPTNGSNILIVLAHIPPGVGIKARDPLPCDPTTECVGGNLTFDPVETDTGDPMCASPGKDGLGVACFWYPIDSTNTNVVEWATFGYKLWSHGPLLPNQHYQITATVYLWDLNPSTVPPDMPYFTLPEQPTISVVEFLDCVTKLLFPYVNTFTTSGTAFTHWDTGIDIANTTWDPFAWTTTATSPTCNTLTSTPCYLYPDEWKGSAVPQNGSCTIYFYPANEGTTIVYTTPTISAGGSLGFDVAAPSGAGVTTSGGVFYNMTGYAIAICNFQNAYGVAEIWDNAGIGDPTSMYGYLAYVLPEPAFYHRSPAGDGLGESAIAPININHWILKLLMTGGHH